MILSGSKVGNLKTCLLLMEFLPSRKGGTRRTLECTDLFKKSRNLKRSTYYFKTRKSGTSIALLSLKNSRHGSNQSANPAKKEARMFLKDRALRRLPRRVVLSGPECMLLSRTSQQPEGSKMVSMISRQEALTVKIICRSDF